MWAFCGCWFEFGWADWLFGFVCGYSGIRMNSNGRNGVGAHTHQRDRLIFLQGAYLNSNRFKSVRAKSVRAKSHRLRVKDLLITILSLAVIGAGA